MQRIDVNTDKKYEIVISSGILKDCGREIKPVVKGKKALIVTDSNVFPIYSGVVSNSLEEHGFEIFTYVFKAGEQSKRLNTIYEIYDVLANNEFSRKDFIVALGGGVTGDMAGFAAASYQRGIDFVQIPTSLLAQVDSSVGGKTGVDIPQGKNLVGAFWQPSLVLIDPDTLSTLPQVFFEDGMAEVIKYGCISDKDFFEFLEKNDANENIEKIISTCVKTKRDIVSMDERESGIRMLLNFGHTMGHALEKLYDYSRLTHGQAVAVGMVLAAKAGERKNITAPGTAERIEKLLIKNSLPVSDAAPLSELVKNAFLDKKSSGDNINIVLLKKIGKSYTMTIKKSEMEDFFNTEKARSVVITPSEINGEVTIPCSKSFAHRALICAALSKGISKIENIQMSDDIRATINALEALGAKFEIDKDEITVDGSFLVNPINTPHNKQTTIDCNESGSTLRFIIPIACALGLSTSFTGKGRLPERPIGIYNDCLPQKGITMSTVDGLPLEVSGKLRGGRYVIPGNISSQFISGLLMALPLLQADSVIEVTGGIQSKGYIDITVSVLKHFGVEITEDKNCYYIKGGQSFKPCNYFCEGDWSQAAFFLAMGVTAGKVKLNGLNLTSIQGDMEIVNIIKKMGGDLKLENGSITAYKSKLNPIDINAEQIPDIVPVLSVLCALSGGKCCISGVQRLRLKESDRLKTTSDILTALGIGTEVDTDKLIIHGKESFQSGTIDGASDHRIVMSGTVAALSANEDVTVTCSDCIQKSYPAFFEDFTKVGGKVSFV